MEEFCRAEGVPFDICGKVIVATDESELPRTCRHLRARPGERRAVRDDRPGATPRAGAARCGARRHSRARGGHRQLRRSVRAARGPRPRRRRRRLRSARASPAFAPRRRKASSKRRLASSRPVRWSTVPACTAIASRGSAGKNSTCESSPFAASTSSCGPRPSLCAAR